LLGNAKIAKKIQLASYAMIVLSKEITKDTELECREA